MLDYTKYLTLLKRNMWQLILGISVEGLIIILSKYILLTGFSWGIFFFFNITCVMGLAIYKLATK